MITCPFCSYISVTVCLLSLQIKDCCGASPNQTADKMSLASPVAASLITDSPHEPTHLASCSPTHRRSLTPPPSNDAAPAKSHNHQHHHSSPVPITDSSPRSVRRVWTDSDEREIMSASPVRDLVEEEWRHHTPSSPLLTAVREAVDSINQYDDFEILEKIGAGFFADVFKVGIYVYVCIYCTSDNVSFSLAFSIL